MGNGSIDLRRAYPHYDIWSLGVILYRLIYKRSPFCKEGKLEFSKTILRKYLANEYEVRYLSNKYASINRFIARCLKVGQKEGLGEKAEEFKSWPQVMEWAVREEEIYNQLDFYDGHFQDMAEMHLRLMTLLSGIYCLIADQCSNSPHPFWHIPISANQRVPFHTKIA